MIDEKILNHFNDPNSYFSKRNLNFSIDRASLSDFLKGSNFIKGTKLTENIRAMSDINGLYVLFDNGLPYPWYVGITQSGVIDRLKKHVTRAAGGGQGKGNGICYNWIAASQWISNFDYNFIDSCEVMIIDIPNTPKQILERIELRLMFELDTLANAETWEQYRFDELVPPKKTTNMLFVGI